MRPSGYITGVGLFAAGLNAVQKYESPGPVVFLTLGFFVSIYALHRRTDRFHHGTCDGQEYRLVVSRSVPAFIHSAAASFISTGVFFGLLAIASELRQ